jgi:predicted MFS family arabinose efflux permease
MKLPFYIHTTDDMNKRWRIVGILLVVVCVAFTLGLWYTLEESNTQIAANRLASDKAVVLDTMEKRFIMLCSLFSCGQYRWHTFP